VTGSIIATEISAVTFLGAPAIVFAAGGDFTYLQLALGAIAARVIIGIWFVPAFYEREIYSPYDYIGQRLGPTGRGITSTLFLLGAVLGQSVRVLLTALVLQLMTGWSLGASIWAIGLFAVVWTLLGGMTTVIWTDVIQFFVFLLGIVAALVFVCLRLPGGFEEVVRVGQAAGKFRLWNLTADPRVAFTLWTALLANTVQCLNAYGTDQLIAQRMFCCRGSREARKAIIVSSIGQGITVLALLVGVALYAFYQRHPLDGQAADLVAEHVDRIFPLFILQQMPSGLVGLLIAGVFAAAISSLDSVLAALSQTVVTGFYRPLCEHRLRRRAARSPAANPPDEAKQDRHYVRVARVLVVLWGVALCAMAQVAVLAYEHYGDILNLALAMATYTGGAILAAFLLALLPLHVDDRGLRWAAPLSILSVLGISWHQPWAQWTVSVGAIAVFVVWIGAVCRGAKESRHLRRHVGLTSAMVAACALPVLLCTLRLAPDGDYLRVAWPWNAPLGFLVAFAVGYVFGRTTPRQQSGPI